MSDERFREEEIEDPIGDDDQISTPIRYMITS